MPRKVKIEIESKDQVGPTLSKSHKDEMVWERDDGEFTVEWRGKSPFGWKTRDSANGKLTSGPLEAGVELGPYDYDITLKDARTGQQAAADPTVFIDP